MYRGFSFVLPNSQDALVKPCSEKTQSVWIRVVIMKFLVFLLNVLAIVCVAGKSWDTNGYVNETSCISSWMSHAKRVLLIALMLTAVVLYYFPEARYYARKGCYLLVDLVANSLKSALNVTESNYACDKLKSKYSNRRYERIYQSKANQFPEGIYAYDETDYNHDRHRNYTIEEERLKRHDKRRHREHIAKRSKDDKHSHRHRHRHQRHHNSERIVAKDSYEARSCGTSGIYFSGRQESDTSAVCPGEVYTSYVIRGPQELTMIDRKYETSDVILVNDAYRVGGNDEKKLDVIYSEDDDPTRDRDRYLLADEIEGIKTYDKSNEKGDGHTDNADVELEVTNKERQKDDDSNSSNQEIQSTDFTNNWGDDQSIIYEKRNVHEQGVTVGADYESSKNVEHTDYPPTEGCCLDRIQEQNDNEDQSKGMEILTELEEQIIKLDRMVRVMKPEIQKQGLQQYDKNQYALQTIETVLKDMKRGFREFDDKLKNQRTRKNYRSFSMKERERRSSSFKRETNHDNRDFTAIQNLSKATRISRRHDLDVEPQKENFGNASMNAGDNRMLNDDDNDEEYSNVPIIRNRIKPALLRAIDWLFTDCPNSRYVATDNVEVDAHVGKEDIRETFNEWLPGWKA